MQFFNHAGNAKRIPAFFFVTISKKKRFILNPGKPHHVQY